MDTKEDRLGELSKRVKELKAELKSLVNNWPEGVTAEKNGARDKHRRKITQAQLAIEEAQQELEDAQHTMSKAQQAEAST